MFILMFQIGIKNKLSDKQKIYESMNDWESVTFSMKRKKRLLKATGGKAGCMHATQSFVKEKKKFSSSNAT